MNKPINLNCESCPNMGVEFAPYKVIDNINMCIICQKRDAEVKIELDMNKSLNNENNDMENDPIELIDNLVATIALDNIDEPLVTFQDFFNAETKAFVVVREEIFKDKEIPDDQKFFEYARRIKEQHFHFRRVLFEVKKVEVEINARDRALQYLLNSILSKFKTEEREKLKLSDINYQPKVVANKAPRVRLTGEAKLIDNYARMMNISVEEATKLFKNFMRTAADNITTDAVTSDASQNTIPPITSSEPTEQLDVDDVMANILRDMNK